MSTTTADAPDRFRPVPRLFTSEAFWTTVAVSWLLVWLLLQTPIALFAYQYGGVPAGAARALLLLKDVAVAVLVLWLVLRHYRALGLRWFDWLALGYVALVAVYSIIPWLTGSELPFMAVAASARIFVMPVELYALGRLALLAGARRDLIVDVFLAATAIAAAYTVGLYLLAPASLWETTIDMLRFVREVQGLPGAWNLSSISILGHYGVGESGQFLRAIGPFTHPVGTSNFFVVPLLLAVARSMYVSSAGRRAELIGWLALVVLFTAAVLTPISRGAWMAAGVGAVLCGVFAGRLRAALVGLFLVALFVLLVPPFNLSVWSALSLEDSSVIGHTTAIEEGVETVAENPFGLGVGQADQMGSAYGGSESAGVGENLYLSVLVTVGPLGLLAFLGWMAGIGLGLLPRRRDPRDWARIAIFAALVGFAVAALTASALMRFTTSAAFWLLVGLLVVPAAVDVRLSAAVATLRRRMSGETRP